MALNYNLFIPFELEPGGWSQLGNGGGIVISLCTIKARGNYLSGLIWLWLGFLVLDQVKLLSCPSIYEYLQCSKSNLVGCGCFKHRMEPFAGTRCHFCCCEQQTGHWQTNLEGVVQTREGRSCGTRLEAEAKSNRKNWNPLNEHKSRYAITPWRLNDELAKHERTNRS